MPPQPLVSICLPIFNGERHVTDGVISVLRQTYQNWELLVTDDNSTDLTRSIIKQFAQADSRIRLYRNKEKLGLFGNYNACMSIAAGTYIKPFAHDDTLEPTAIAKLVDLLETKPAVALVSCRKTWIDDGGKPIEPASDMDRQLAQPYSENTRRGGMAVATETFKAALNWIGEPCTVMFRSAYMDSGFDSRIGQLGDIEYWYRILQNGDWYYLVEPLCNFRRHPGQATATNRRSLHSMLDWLVVANKHRHLIKAIGLTEDEYNRQFARRIIDAVGGRLTMAEVPVNDKFANLMDYPGALSAFEADHTRPRDKAAEYHAFLNLVLREAAESRNQIRAYEQGRTHTISVPTPELVKI